MLGVAARARWARLSVSLTEALVLFLVLRIALSVFGAMATLLWPVPGPCFHHGVVDWIPMPELFTEGAAARLLGVWQRWDACWYLRIAEFGYLPGEPGTAFFPLYPLAIRLLAPLFPGNFTLAALVISAFGYIVAMTILHAIVTRDVDRRTAERSMLYLSVFPTAFFLFGPFTESLFLSLALAAIYCARTGRFWLAVPFALLAGLARPHGVFLAIPLAWEAFQVLREHRFQMGHRSAFTGGALAAAGPVVGFAAVAYYSESVVGVSIFEAERQHWGFAAGPPWEVLGRAVAWMFDPALAGDPGIQAMIGLHLVLLALFAALFIVGLRRVPITYSLYVAPLLLTIAFGSPVTPLASASRYMLVMFPIFVVLGQLGRERRFHTAWVVCSVMGLCLLFTAILMNFPVG